MRTRRYRTKLQSFGISKKNPGELIKGVVRDVITDNDHPLFQDRKVPFGRIGYIQFVPMGALFTSADEGLYAAPLDKNITTLPLRNEKVDIIKTTTGYYYRRGNGNISPNVDGESNTYSTFFNEIKDDSSANSSEYQSTSNTGIANKSTTTNDETAGFGEYFKSQADSIHPLKLFEGDTLLQSRFGQSIRFSGYNNSEKKLHPSIIIRNRENNNSQNELEKGSHTEEDINKDGSIISLTSGEFKLDFQPGVVSDKGSSNFETKPGSFQKYPSELKGDQILINSGRIIISSKESEMIFYSKGNYGFISDGTMSIDNKGGILAAVQDDIFVTTNDSDIRFTSGDGEIHIGNGNSEEPIAKGDTLVNILNEILTEIVAMNHATPAGPSSPPLNAAKFSAIQGKLNTILSKKNFVD